MEGNFRAPGLERAPNKDEVSPRIRENPRRDDGAIARAKSRHEGPEMKLDMIRNRFGFNLMRGELL